MADRAYYIARTYAQAILRYHNPTYTRVTRCATIGAYFQQHGVSSLFLRLSSVSPDDKVAVVMRVIQQRYDYDADDFAFVRSILRLLQRDGRLHLFMRVCHMVYHAYQHVHGIEPCRVVTSHAVDAQHLSPVITWLERRVGKTLEPYYIVDERIIAGIRVRGETFFWEDSVARSVRRMQHVAYAQWGIW